MMTNPTNDSVLTGHFDVERVREDFPALKQRVHDRPLVYLDNAATSQKPLAVINAVNNFYGQDCSNIHRGVHTLSERATQAYENSRITIQKFINANSLHEVVFVRGTTEAINLVASTFGRKNIKAGDEIIVSAMEHHSNIVPWQMLCEEKGAHLKVIPMDETGTLRLDEFEKLLNDRTKLVAVTHVSNALGTINPIKKMIQIAHAKNVPVLIDGAQAVPHLKVDVQDLDCDFYTFSSHKIYGPTGVGILYGKEALLEKMPPYQGGGDMISSVTFEKTTYNTLPYKFEAGTPDIAGGIGLGAAIRYLNGLGFDAVAKHEHDLLTYATEVVGSISGIRLIGTSRDKTGVLSFVFDEVHPHDVGTLLDQEGIAIRTGHHCAQPVMDFFGIPASCRASFAVYNTKNEIDLLGAALERVKGVFG